MVGKFSARAILQGAVILGVGYGASALAATGAANSGSTVLVALAGLLFLASPIAAGSRAAALAQERRITHGLVAGLAGTVLVVVGLLVFRTPLAPAHFVALGVTLALGSWLGALLFAVVASRRGR
jgi:hypothetical protein